ncbi:hypothetical protein MC885_015985 [Smutsia gigantea]|nr:hypothetical protein MC885_015985 [Smutsia gigantea]
MHAVLLLGRSAQGVQDNHSDSCREWKLGVWRKILKLNLKKEEEDPASAPDTARPPSEEQSTTLEKPKQKKNRCFMCRKKVGLTGFECRCGNVYCGAHRYSDVHSCSYNYRADAAEKIRKENPVVVGEKIQKI